MDISPHACANKMSNPSHTSAKGANLSTEAVMDGSVCRIDADFHTINADVAKPLGNSWGNNGTIRIEANIQTKGLCVLKHLKDPFEQEWLAAGNDNIKDL
nr:hypothetical protein [Thermogemmatispora carboxidivorans]